MKRCTKCEETKPLADFSRDPARSDGLSSWCKPCRAEAQAERRAVTTPEQRAAAMRAYKAGFRKDKCATCGNPVEGLGVCEPCRAAMKQLGDSPEALKLAAKALKWLQE